MKTLFKTTIVLALIIFAGSSSANSIDTYIKVRGNNSFSVHHNLAGEFKFTIKNEFGRTLYSVKANENQAFVKTFDVQNLPEGNYQLEVEDANTISTYPLQILSDTLILNRNSVDKIFKPSIQHIDKKLDISMLKLNNEPLEVYIYDSQNKLVHSTKLQGNVINKRFDLSQLQAGSYLVYLEVGTKSFKKNIQL